MILATKAYAHDSALRSWWHILSTSFLLALAFAGTCWNVHWLGQLACTVLAGLLILRLFVIYHDQQHHAILPNSRLAEGYMRLVGLLFLSPSSVWRSSHNHHHHHNSKLRGSHIGSFPIMTRGQFENSSTWERFQYLAVRHPLTVASGYLTMFVFGMCLVPFWSDPKKHYDGIIALVGHFAISALLVYFGGWQQLLLTQTIPYVVGYAIGCYLFYAQHNFPAVALNEKAGWTYEKAALESSSYLVTGPIMGWFTGYIGYHHIHHLNHKIPFYRLQEAMAGMPELQRAHTTSLGLGDVMRCFRLKVWDPSVQRMVGFRELARTSAVSSSETVTAGAQG